MVSRLQSRFLTLLSLGWMGFGCAQKPLEEQAREETSIEGLRLLDASARGPRLTALGVNLGYVETDTRPGGGQYFCGAMSADDSRVAGSVITIALSKLSDKSLNEIKLRYVILCNGTAAGGQRIGGIPVPPLDLLMVDAGVTSNDPLSLQHTFLHELYHLVEFRFDTYQDAEWQSLFDAGYANSYEGLIESRIGSGRPGFVNAYAATYPHEDRAELFATLLLRSSEVAGHLRSSRDDLLKAKVLYMIANCRRLIGLDITLPSL